MPIYQKTLIPDSSNACGQCWRITEGGVPIWDAPDANGRTQIFAYDANAGVTSAITNIPTGTKFGSTAGDIVTFGFTSDASDGREQSYVYDLATHTTTLIDTSIQWGGSTMYRDTTAAEVNSYGDLLFGMWGGGGFGNWLNLLIGGVQGDLINVAGSWDPIHLQFISFGLNNRKDVYYLAADYETSLEQLHLWSQGNDILLGTPGGYHVSWNAMNNLGWVVWTEHPGPLTGTEVPPQGTFLYDGSTTTQILPALLYPYSLGLNDRGQIIYEWGTCAKLDVHLYHNGTIKIINTGKKYNVDPSLNNYGEIVWSASDTFPSSEAIRQDIYFSDNGGTPEIIASPGLYPVVNDLGQVIYWDPDAQQLILLSPTGWRYRWRRFFRYLLRHRLWRLIFRLLWRVSIDRSHGVRPLQPPTAHPAEPPQAPRPVRTGSPPLNFSARRRWLRELGRPWLPEK